jgi:hypothetical protein
MAKKGGKSKGNVSAGMHSNVARSVVNATRKEYLASGDRVLNQLASFRKGGNVVLTIPNPNPNETNKRFIRVPASQVWKS